MDPEDALDGQSELGKMCTPDACMIVNEHFLTTSWLGAHEIAHV